MIDINGALVLVGLALTGIGLLAGGGVGAVVAGSLQGLCLVLLGWFLTMRG
jgi:hypothetical protein